MISRMMDWLEKKVYPIHQAVYKEEQPVTFIPYNQTSAAYQANNLYQQAAGQQAVYTTAGVLGCGSGVYTSQNSINSNGPWVNPSSVTIATNQTAPYWIPPRTGFHYAILFVDAAGFHHNIVVDQAHAGILQQISGMTNGGGVLGSVAVPFTPSTPSQPKMLEGDFSFDEMEAAENLIAELSSGRNQRNEQGQDAGCAAEG